MNLVLLPKFRCFSPAAALPRVCDSCVQHGHGASSAASSPAAWPVYRSGTPHARRQHILHSSSGSTGVSSTTGPAAAAAADVAADGQSTPGVEGDRLVLLDAFAVLYRAHYSFGPSARLTTSGGLDTSVLYGFLSVLLALLEAKPPPSHFAVVMDTGGTKTFRHELFSGYKGQRPPMPQEIADTIPQLRELLKLMHIPTFACSGLEADDIIATLARRGVLEGLPVTIASPDKDFFQLLQPGIELLRPSRPRKGSSGGPVLMRYTEDNFREEWGLEPHQFADLLALMGDASDNVPGVAGIGPKTGAPLLAQHGTLENVLAAASEVKRKGVREALMSEDGAAAARLSRRLVTLQTDVDVPALRFPLSELKLAAPEDSGRAALASLGTLEFRQHARRLQGIYGSSTGATA